MKEENLVRIKKINLRIEGLIEHVYILSTFGIRSVTPHVSDRINLYDQAGGCGIKMSTEALAIIEQIITTQANKEIASLK